MCEGRASYIDFVVILLDLLVVGRSYPFSTAGSLPVLLWVSAHVPNMQANDIVMMESEPHRDVSCRTGPVVSSKLSGFGEIRPGGCARFKHRMVYRSLTRAANRISFGREVVDEAGRFQGRLQGCYSTDLTSAEDVRLRSTRSSYENISVR